MRAVKCHLSNDTLGIDLTGLIFFGASGVQLYFIPLLLLFQAQALAILLLFRTPKWRLISACIAAGTLIYSYIGSVGEYFGFNHAFITGAAYVTLAFILNYTQSNAAGSKINTIIGWFVPLLIAFSLYLDNPLAALGIMQGPIFGYCIASLALNWNLSVASITIRKLMTYSYGIYLAHFGFLEFLNFQSRDWATSLHPIRFPPRFSLGFSFFYVVSFLFR